MAPRRRLTHIDSRNRARMVDVGGKKPTVRSAHAVAVVVLPRELARLLSGGELRSPKGPVFQTAILAGIQGAKRTSELIPLCHPLPLEHCSVEVLPGKALKDGSVPVEIHVHARTFARTGVEMEALTGAAVASLALYDMGKAVSHGIVIREIRLLEKTGGKSDYRAA